MEQFLQSMGMFIYDEGGLRLTLLTVIYPMMG